MNHLERIRTKDLDFRLLFNRYKNLALNMFEWEGLPNDLKSRHIEKYLFEYGRAIMYKHDGGFIILGATSDGNLNIMEEPLGYIANGYGYTEHRDLKKSCVCWNNDIAEPTFNYVYQYAEDMCEVKRSINANIKQQKFPYLITTNKNNELSMKKLYEKIQNGEPVIYGSKEIDLNTIQVMQTNTPYVVDKLNQYRYELEREILTFFGLNNNFEKKERLLTDEVNSNNDYVSSNIDLMLKTREEFCIEVNNMFGLNISVCKKYDLQINNGGDEEWQDTQLNLEK